MTLIMHVETDQVHQAEGAEAEARRVDQDAVDGREVRDPFGEHAHRLRRVAAPGVIDDEARRVLAAHRRVAVAPRERGERFADPGFGQRTVDHLDDLHHRHRVEEVVAGDAPRFRAGRGHRGHRQRRGVGGEHAVLADDALERAEQGALGLEILEDRLDHDVAAGELRRGCRQSRSATASRRPRAARCGPFCTRPASDLAIASRAACAAPGLASNSRARAPHCASTCDDAAPHGAAADDTGAQVVAIGVQHENLVADPQGESRILPASRSGAARGGETAAPGAATACRSSPAGL